MFLIFFEKEFFSNLSELKNKVNEYLVKGSD